MELWLYCWRERQGPLAAGRRCTYSLDLPVDFHCFKGFPAYTNPASIPPSPPRSHCSPRNGIDKLQTAEKLDFHLRVHGLACDLRVLFPGCCYFASHGCTSQINRAPFCGSS
jgi:hypothetical protein